VPNFINNSPSSIEDITTTTLACIFVDHSVPQLQNYRWADVCGYYWPGLAQRNPYVQSIDSSVRRHDALSFSACSVTAALASHRDSSEEVTRI